MRASTRRPVLNRKRFNIRFFLLKKICQSCTHTAINFIKHKVALLFCLNRKEVKQMFKLPTAKEFAEKLNQMSDDKFNVIYRKLIDKCENNGNN